MDTIKILVASMLGIAGIMDLVYKRINVLLLFPFIVAGVACNFIYKPLSLLSILGGMTIGLAALLVCFVTREKIGKGDGIVLVVTGLFLGFFDNLFLLMSAAFLAAGVGILLLIGKLVGRNYELPFIPFLFLAFLGGLMVWS
ncbi:prepilin peptidase [Konateibacter massiliensis]|uniref:prepilin peptidase n=1 Tax=Konateibacter massiliensis TaxID=2002841 RepID=UPI000C152C99|nr:A24 family peptidase [Konateibacter massiliensis]